jgi:hypothetical protein
MSDFISLVDKISNVGIPLIITAGVLYVLWLISKTIPSSIKNYIDAISKREEDYKQENQNLQNKYDEQMKIIITVAQQGVESQRRGNEVIERNNVILEGKQKTDERLIEAINTLSRTTSRLDESVNESTECTRKTYTEIIRVGASIKQ